LSMAKHATARRAVARPVRRGLPAWSSVVLAEERTHRRYAEGLVPVRWAGSMRRKEYSDSGSRRKSSAW